MLRIIQSNSASGAKHYYSASDYYMDAQEMAGTWHGRGARMLGLSGAIDRPDWNALCDNRDPITGGPLTVRHNNQRRVGYDFNFHAPKSVSLLYGMTGDTRVLDAFRESVRETMSDIESEMQTRVRKGGHNEDRTTGNMVWGEFVHLTSRPVDGVPDPHLHAHCFVQNLTWDEHESRWKAGQFAGVKRDGAYFEAVFHSRLAHRLESLGLVTERTRTGWELSGISPESIVRFSRRTALIEERAEQQGITDVLAKAELGAKTRECKAKGLGLGELRHTWLARMAEGERADLAAVASQIGAAARRYERRKTDLAVSHAIAHCFERMSVAPERKLLAEAMKHAVGRATPHEVVSDVARHDLIAAEHQGRRMITSRAVLDEEERMLRFARDGRGSRQPLGQADYAIEDERLDDDQRSAVRHLLTSRDRVMLIRGGAGTGKTTMMKAAVRGIEEGGHRVLVFAPSAQASRGVLREQEGFVGADTVSRLLVDDELQQQARGQVLWVDEAGLLGSRAMVQLFDLADRIDARVIVSGDRKQHGSVERGAALRLLEEEAGLMPAELRQIKRQRAEYKDIVHAVSEGRIGDAFREMNRLGWVRQVDDEERYGQLAKDYIESVSRGEAALVVSPTHREGDKVTSEIREGLRASGLLRGEDHLVPMLVGKSLTEAERTDPLNYDRSDVLVYHQNAKGRRKGERVVVEDAPLPVEQASRFQVFCASSLPLAVGDRVRITRNGSTLDRKHRLNNGAIYTLERFDRHGNLVLDNGWTVARDYGHLAHGYTTTSHASQGRTVDRVFIAQSSDALAVRGSRCCGCCHRLRNVGSGQIEGSHDCYGTNKDQRRKHCSSA